MTGLLENEDEDEDEDEGGLFDGGGDEEDRYLRGNETEEEMTELLLLDRIGATTAAFNLSPTPPSTTTSLLKLLKVEERNIFLSLISPIYASNNIIIATIYKHKLRKKNFPSEQIMILLSEIIIGGISSKGEDNK